MTFLRDPVSSSSHLLTAAWAVFATLIMFRLTANRPGRLFPVIVYGVSMVALFLASGTFHGLHYNGDEVEKRFYQKLDQSAVYCLIAGTYTPIIAIVLVGAWRRWLLRMVWSLAFTGVACMWLLPKAPHEAIVGIYVLLGWIGTPPLPLYYRALGWRAMNYVWLGGGLYSVGAICELAKWPVLVPGWFGFHEMLHITHSAAAMVFFLFIVRHVIPYQRAATTSDAPGRALSIGLPSHHALNK